MAMAITPVKNAKVKMQVDYRLKRSAGAAALTALSLMLPGALLLLLRPAPWVELGLIVASGAILSGAVRVLAFFRAEKGYCPMSTLLLGGLGLVFGLAALYTVGMVAYLWLTPYAIAAWALVTGIAEAAASDASRQAGDPAWVWMLFSGVLSILLAAGLLCSTLFSADILISGCGAFLLISGLAQLGQFASSAPRKREKREKHE